MLCNRNVLEMVFGKPFGEEAYIAAYRACCHVSLYAPLALSCGALFSSDCMIQVQANLYMFGALQFL